LPLSDPRVHQTVANWVAAHAAALPAQLPQPQSRLATAEPDELYTLIEDQWKRARRTGETTKYALRRIAMLHCITDQVTGVHHRPHATTGDVCCTPGPTVLWGW
jgi:hypothetical protein